MVWSELIELASPLLINLGYTKGMERPDLPEGTIIEIPLLIKPGAERGTVNQFDWINKTPIFYKALEENK